LVVVVRVELDGLILALKTLILVEVVRVGF
jgi:hypothetical protein